MIFNRLAEFSMCCCQIMFLHIISIPTTDSKMYIATVSILIMYLLYGYEYSRRALNVRGFFLTNQIQQK